MRQIDPITSRPARAKCHGIRHQCINVVTTDTPQHLWKAGQNIRCTIGSHRQQIRQQPAKLARRFGTRRQRSEMGLAAVRHDGVNAQHVVTHHSISNGPAATAVIAGHASNGRPAGGRHINRKPKPMRL